MITRKNKKELIITVLLIALLIVGLVIGCANQLTKSDVNNPNSKVNNFETYEYVISNYLKKYDTSHYKDVLNNNPKLVASARSGNFYEVMTFIVENIDLFSDSSLFQELVEEARVIHNIDDSVEIPNPFSKNSVGLVLDYEKQNTGLNLLRFTVEDFLDLYNEELAIAFSSFERENFDIFVNMILNEDIQTTLKFLNLSLQEHSGHYLYMLNNFAYYYEYYNLYHPSKETFAPVLATLASVALSMPNRSSVRDLGGTDYSCKCGFFCRVFKCGLTLGCYQRNVLDAANEKFYDLFRSSSVPAIVIELWAEEIITIIDKMVSE